MTDKQATVSDEDMVIQDEEEPGSSNPGATKDASEPSLVVPPFVWFARETRERVQKENPEALFEGQQKIIRSMYDQLDANAKKQYEDLSAKDQLRHKKEMTEFTATQTKLRTKKRRIDTDETNTAKTAYLFFANEKEKEYDGDKPECTSMELSKRIGDAWRELPDDEKQLYKERHEASKPESARDNDSGATRGGLSQKNTAPFSRDFFYGTSQAEYETISLASFLIFAEEVRANLGPTYAKSNDTKVHTTISKSWIDLAYDDRVRYAIKVINQPETVSNNSTTSAQAAPPKTSATPTTTTTPTMPNGTNLNIEPRDDDQSRDTPTLSTAVIDSWHKAKAQSKIANYNWVVDDTDYTIDLADGVVRLGEFEVEVGAKGLRKSLKTSAVSGKGVVLVATVNPDQAESDVKKCTATNPDGVECSKGLEIRVPLSKANTTDTFHMILQKQQLSKNVRIQITHTTKKKTESNEEETTVKTLIGTSTSTGEE